MPAPNEGNAYEPARSVIVSRTNPFATSARVIVAPAMTASCSSRTVPLNAALPNGACAANGYAHTRTTIQTEGTKGSRVLPVGRKRVGFRQLTFDSFFESLAAEPHLA